MVKKKTWIIGIGIIVVCLIAAGVGLVLNRSTKREATEQELAEYAPYSVDWKALPEAGGRGTEKEIILSMCQSAGEKEIGGGTYDVFMSDTLGAYLYRFSEMTEIFQGDGDTLFVSYTDTDGRTVILVYDDEGICERGIYDPQTDTFFHESQGTVEVWTKFRSGIQWGF